jgi:hypothetical protein
MATVDWRNLVGLALVAHAVQGCCDPVSTMASVPYEEQFGDDRLRARFDETHASLEELRALATAHGVSRLSERSLGLASGAGCGSGRRSGRFPWRCHGNGPEREVTSRSEVDEYLGLPAGTAAELARLRGASRARHFERRDGTWEAILTGPSGSWGKAYVWTPTRPDPVHDRTTAGPRCGTVYAHLRGSWYLRRSGCLE